MRARKADVKLAVMITILKNGAEFDDFAFFGEACSIDERKF